jgi:hypothetical protein
MSPNESCPHCDSVNVRSMARRAHEGDSAINWHECVDCGRMWSVRKHPAEDPTSDEGTMRGSHRRVTI